MTTRDEPARSNALALSVIIPTYCEAENLGLLVPRLTQVLREAKLEAEILVVDDNSPDATRTVCAELARTTPLTLLVREDERGLSSAVIHGMRAARGEILLVMDADLSHPPEKVPDLVEQIRQGADFVIGSRYVPGASTDETWGLFRWVNSKVATLLARPLTHSRDPMAGFFAIRRTRFEACTELNPIGYKIGLELIVKGRCRDVREVPIHFADRVHGESKLNFREQVLYLRHLGRLYVHKAQTLPRVIRFLAVGATGMIVDLTIFWLLLAVAPLGWSRALAIWCAMTWNFFLNRKLTFRDATRESVSHQYALFCASCLLGGLVNWGTTMALVLNTEFFADRTLPAAFVGIVAGTVLNYYLSLHLAFKSPRRGKTTDAAELD